MGAHNQQLRNDLNRDFMHVKHDIEALNIRIMLLESENKRLREELMKKENEELKRKISEKTEQSQDSLSLSKLRMMMEEILGKPLREQNTNASSVFSAETQQEFAPIFPQYNYSSMMREKEEGNKLEIEEENIFPQSKKIDRNKDQLKNDLLKSYQRNRKNIIKQQILGEILKGEYTKIALRDLIVEQKKYCSKASFYRYIEELELETLIGQHRRKGKDIVVAKQENILSSRGENSLENSKIER